MRGVFDVEANGLLDHTTIDYRAAPFKLKPIFRVWCAVIIDIDTGRVYRFAGEEEMRTGFVPLFKKLKTVIGHNIIDYDLLVLKLYFGIDYEIADQCTIDGQPVEIVDTLVWSKALNPDRYGGHSLDEWGKRLGLEKIDWRQRAVDLGLIPWNAPRGAEFAQYHPEMLDYNERDCHVNVKLYWALLEEVGEWDWSDTFTLEQCVRDIVTRGSHRGFWFDQELAQANVRDLDEKMESIRQTVEPLLPEKPMGVTKLKAFLPPKIQFLKNGNPSSHMQKFAEKHGGTLEQVDGKWVANIFGKAWSLPMAADVPVKTHEPATVKDTTHIKGWLVEMGWRPTQYKERDLTCDSKKKKLSPEKFAETVERYVEQTINSPFCRDRCEELNTVPSRLREKLLKHDLKRPLKVYTNPTITVGMEKEIDPALLELAGKFPHAKLVSEYLTYAHRRNSILGGGVDPDELEDDDEFAGKGFLAAERIAEDGRIPTPADSCGAGCLSGDTLILTDNGVVPIIEVGIGDLVLTHEGVYERVVDRIQNGIKPVIRVTLSTGNVVTCTLNHPFRVGDEWVQAGNLKVGDDVMILQEQEKWGQLDGYSNYYISSWGRVLNTAGECLKTAKRRAIWDRANVDLIADNGVRRREGIGRLVLKCFVGEPSDGQETLHADNNPLNNFLSNLSWGTSKENTSDQKTHGVALKASRTRRDGKLTANVVAEIKQYFDVNGYTRGDDTRLAKKYGVSRELVGDIRTGARWADGNEYSLYVQDFTTAKVASLEKLAPIPTYDITVENAHSYVANGVVTHNTSRFKHRLVANIPRVTSLYGKNMRAQFGVDVEDGFVQLGYDFDSLEAKIEAHYVYRYKGGPEYGVSLTAERPNDCHCFDSETEILTESGWKKFGELQLWDKVAQYWPNTGKADFIRPSSVVWQDYNGPMISTQSDKLSMLVTPGHRVLYKTFRGDGAWKVEEAGNLLSKTHTARIPSQFTLTGGAEESNDYLNVLLAVQADGHFATDCRAISLSFVKERKIESLTKSLDALGETYTISRHERKGRSEVTVRLPSGTFTDKLRQDLTDKKALPWSLLNLSEDSRMFVVGAIGLWDGTMNPGGDIVLDTRCRQSVEVCQALAVSVGLRATVSSYFKRTDFGEGVLHRCYISFASKLLNITKENTKTVHYEGKIGCVSVPSSFVVVRREGKVFISGNSVLAAKISGLIGRPFPRSTAKNVKYGCLPVDNTDVLTRDGWKTFNEIGVGDFVLGYHATNKEMYWTEVTGRHFYADADVGLVGNKRWSVEATEDHRWLAKNAYSDEVRLVYTDELNTASSILNSSPMRNGGTVQNDAALIGWLLADGHWKWSESLPCRQNRHGEKLGVIANVGQKKFCDDVEVALRMARVNFTVYSNGGMNEYRIDPEDFRAMAKRHGFYGKGKHEFDWVQYVLGLDGVSRMNFILAFWQADGRQGVANAVVVRQRPGNIADAIAVAMALEGMKTTVRVDGEGMATINGSQSAYTGYQTGDFTPTRKTDVFCLSTACESFFIRQGGVLTLTGNCSYNAQPPRVAKTIGCSLEDAQTIFDTFWTQAAPLKELKEKMQQYWETTGQKKFLKGLDNRKLPIRSKGNVINTAFQSAGVICAKRAMVLHDRKLKAEGMAVDFFRDNWKEKEFCQQLIAYHDEAQLEVKRSLVKFKTFPVGVWQTKNEETGKMEDSKEAKEAKAAASAFKAAEEEATGKRWSDVMKGPKGYFVGYCRAGELATEAVVEAGRYYKLNVELSAGYMLGRNWAECH